LLVASYSLTCLKHNSSHAFSISRFKTSHSLLLLPKESRLIYGGLNIGAAKDLDEGSFFSGLSDDVRINNEALSTEEIEALA